MFHFARNFTACRLISVQINYNLSCNRKYGLINPNLVFGQPTASTHPHLLKENEILPSIQKEEFVERRTKLVNLIKQYMVETKNVANSHIIVIPSAVKKYMSDKIPYIFRQNSDYLYLTGCLEPDSCLVIHSAQNSEAYTATMFVRNPDSQSEIWDGPRTNSESAPILFGVHHALPISELPTYLRSYITSNKDLAIWYDYVQEVQPTVNNLMVEFLKDKPKYGNPTSLIHKLRLIKSPAEIKLIRKSCEIASEAIVETIGNSYEGISEHELFARVDFGCRMRGAEYLAYPPVVAGGERATIIHYVNNNQKINNNEMVLMDAGCEYHGYTSDITRTWPINGKFTTQQRELYEIIHAVQQQLFKELHTFPPLDHLFDIMINLLAKYLKEIGLIPKTAFKENLFREAYKFCPHHVSHYLGMDVHDTGLCPRNIKLEPGMIITVEPGLYMNKKFKIPDAYKGLGVRIEDDILMTVNGPEILTNKCPRDISDIENLIRPKIQL